MSESNVRHALRRSGVLFSVLVFGSAVPLGLGMLVLSLFARFAPEERSWHILGLLVASQFLLSSLVAIAVGAFVYAMHVLRDVFGLGQSVRVKGA